MKGGGKRSAGGQADSLAASRGKILFPAIDLKGGECVRLTRGEMDSAVVYNRDPAAQAAAFERMGFEWLHVVDLDGAFAGEARNARALEAIAASTSASIQFGGGIRSLRDVELALSRGASRVILSTLAVREPQAVRLAAKEFPGRIAVGVDARQGRVAVEGWAKETGIGVEELALRFEGEGVCALIHTEISRDGALVGADWDASISLARSVSIPVIVSGGIASMADIERMIRPDASALEGAICGKAIYDGRIDPIRALETLREASVCESAASGGGAEGVGSGCGRVPQSAAARRASAGSSSPQGQGESRSRSLSRGQGQGRSRGGGRSEGEGKER